MGRPRRQGGRSIDGVLLLDKPAGITSNEALQHVKRLYCARKAGHTGSLDRMASGLLPLCFGEATKFSSFLLESDKHYQARCRLGVRTTTGDAAGESVATRPVPADACQRLARLLPEFRGEILQVPPMYSALKQKGTRLYELAYQGIEVERAPRRVTIRELDLIDCAADQFRIRLLCSKGTYVRTLAEDIGERLGCGAHVAELRRTGSGPFRDPQMVTLAELEALAPQGTDSLDQLLLGIDRILFDCPAVHLADSVAYYVARGQAVMVPRAPTHGLVRMYDEHNAFLGAGMVLDDGRIAPRRLLSA
jgi:tRNA pseudouridine55 synthase